VTKRAELADGRVLEFPDDTPMEVIQRVVKEQIAASKASTSVPATVAAAPTAEARLQARQPLKEVEAPGLFDYFTNREAAIKQARERTAYMQELGQRGALEDIKTQTGFFDRLGDFFSRGLLSTTANIKDTQRAIESDPELKKQFTEEARRFAADKGVEIKGATTEEDVKKNFLRNVVPYILEKGAESIPGMLAAGIPIPGLGLAQNFGSQGREAAELEGRQDVELSDLGKVAPGALAVTALDQLGLGGIFAAPAKTVLGRIGKAAMLEGGTEAIQSAIEYANPRVVTGSDIDAGEMFEQAAFGALVGGGIGGGGRGGIEAVSAALNRGKKEAKAETNLGDSPQVEQEYLRLLTVETQALRDQNPDLTQRQAFNQAVKDAGKLYDTAIVNTMLGPEGEADVVSDVDTGMDVVGGVGAGVAPDIEPSAAATGASDLGEAVAGGLERPVSGVSVPDVGEGAGVSPLTAAPAFDITPIMEAPTLQERTTAAQQIVSDVAMATPELQALPKGKYTQAANQMARSAARGEQFDPVDIVYNVAGIERPAPVTPAPAFEPMAAPAVPAAPSVDEVAVAPVKAAIEAVIAPTTGPIPTLAQTSAQQLGVAPTTPTAQAAPVRDDTISGAIYDAKNNERNPLTYEDLIDQLDFLETLATQGKLTPERLAFSDFGQVQDTGTLTGLKNRIASDPVGTIQRLRESAELNNQRDMAEAAPTITPPPAAPEMAALPPLPEMAAPTIEPTPAPPAVRTVNDMAGIGTVNPDNTNEVLVGGGGIQLTPLADNVLKVDSLRAVETGGGRKAMEQLIEVADANGTELQLSPEPFAAEAGKEMTPTELTGWYSGFGFQEQPDGTMVRPAPTAAPPTTTPTAAATPQEILTDLESFAVSEAQDRDLDQDAFLEGVDDIRSGREPMSYYDALKAYGLDTTTVSLGPSEGGDVALSRIAGAQWAQERVAEAQTAAPVVQEAAPTPAPAEVASEVPPTATGGTGAPPAPPPPPAATGGTGGPAPKKPKVVSNGKPVVLTEAQKRTALAKAKATREKMNRIQKRIAATNDTADVLSGGVDLAKLVRGDKENWALLRGAIDTVDVGRWQLILPTLSTEDIFRILKGRIPGLTEADRIIQQDVTRFQTKEYLRLADELEQVADFLKKYPKAAQALSDLEFATVAYQVDPTKANSAEEYFAKVDGKAKEIRAQIKAEKDPKKKGRLEAKLKNRSKDIESVYIGVPGDERVIGWRDLGRPEFGSNKGKEIFKLLRDGHRRDLEAKYDALRSRLMETKKDKALDEALEKLEAQFKPALEQVIYFPAMRFGSYYARVGTGVNSIFKLFETPTQRNQFVRIMESRGEEVTETGNVEDLRDNFEQVTGGPLKEVLDLFEGDQKDIGALKSQVFDLWLQTMSAGDMRKHMAPRKMRAGYSTDILKNFANFRRSSTNDVKRAKFGYKLRTEISRAKDMVADMPDREKMNAFIKEIELRTLSDLMPPERGNPYWEAAIQFGNKAAFYQYLANPKTALIQLTQLHIVALPMLAQKYGSAKATAALSKYGFSSLGGFVVSPLKAIKREDGSFTFDWEQPNLLDNPISALKEESDPELYEVLSEGWNEGRDLNLYMDTFANQIGGYGNADPQQRSALQELMRGRVHTAAWRGTTFAFEAMGTLMHQMERVNREATYMAALELAYRENKKKGQPHAEAKKNAIEAAADTTLAATFDFSSYNKPRVLNTGIGRLAGQFMSYPYMMTSLLARNMYTAIKFGKLEPGERKAAIQTATGVMFNIGLYAGLTGVPLYGLFTTIASLLLWAFDDDDEEEGGLSYIDKDGNIKATYDIDWWVRNVWIPKTFGPDGTVANLFDLDDDTAEVLARSVEKGPISAITDIDLSNSVALDFMFFVPRESRADTPEGQLKDYTFSVLTGAFGNVVMDYEKARQDLMNGYTDRALEKLPKLFGNVAKANRFATEGQTNYNRELVGMDADFWSSDKAILQALSFASTEADQRQQQNYEAKSINVKIEKARADFLNKLRKTALDRYQYGVTPETEAAQQQIVKEWVEFNQTYPTHVIGLDSFYEVQNNAVNNAVESYGTRGLPMDPTGVKTPYLSDLYLRRLETEKQ
jgi:hypothetical protein